MENIEIITVVGAFGIESEHVIIYNEDGSQTSIPKPIWDAQQVVSE